MAVIFDEILTKGVRSGQIPARTAKARDWYRGTAKQYKTVKENQFFGSKSDKDRMSSRPLIGGMYMYEYMAKTRAKLPYYDRLPLIFPFKTVKGGFYGLNMHYLPLPLRAKLMDALYETANNSKYDETTRLRINYQILNKAAKFEAFKPCVKRYLNSQVQSKFMYVYPSEWDIALFLPTERFVGASKSTVFAQSKRKI
ncbi:hypothetical protein N9H77_01740 [Porticoccaceae bacterium]|jgi:hypothetical protein|nr:hypothetical protein [Porticoccaceae bacterium]MDB4559066.1 hypothetical protein [bacterium]